MSSRPRRGAACRLPVAFRQDRAVAGGRFLFAGLASQIGQIGQIGQSRTIQLAEFLLPNKDVILTVALCRGEQGHIRAADLISRSQQMRNRLQTDPPRE